MRTLTAMMVGLFLVVSPSAEAAKGKKNAQTTGTITNVTTDNGTGTLTVKIGGKNKAGEEKTFTLTKTTTVQMETKTGTGKGNRAVAPAQLSDLKNGAHVSIKVNGDKIESIKIMSGGKGKKKKAQQ